MAASKRICCVMGCPLATGEPRGMLLPFPERGSARYQQWLMLYPNSFVLRDTGANFICTRHFSANNVDKNGKLKGLASPTLNLNTNRTQEQVLETFLMKVVYEWSLRNASSKSDEINAAAMEAARILAMRDFKPSPDWIKKFQKIREANLKNGLRFVGDLASGRAVSEIIKDLRKYLPSNFIISMDMMDVFAAGDELAVKNECLSDDEVDAVDLYMEMTSDSDQVDVEKGKADPQGVAAAEKTAPIYAQEEDEPLDTYKDAYELLKPLEVYILSSGNSAALARIREIAKVVKEGIDTESKPRRGAKRARNT